VAETPLDHVPTNASMFSLLMTVWSFEAARDGFVSVFRLMALNCRPPSTPPALFMSSTARLNPACCPGPKAPPAPESGQNDASGIASPLTSLSDVVVISPPSSMSPPSSASVGASVSVASSPPPPPPPEQPAIAETPAAVIAR